MNDLEKTILSNKNIKIYATKKDWIVTAFLFKPGWSQRAGIMPYVKEKNKLIFLLAVQEGKYSDFGGGCKKTETPLICAYREFREESRETVHIDLANITHIFITGKKHPHQVILWVKMDKIGNEEYAFFESLTQQKLNGKEYNEVEQIDWVDWKELRSFNLHDSLKTLIKFINS